MILYDHEPHMTVRELIEALQKMEPTLPVRSEGCDCSGPVAAVEMDDLDRGRYVFLRREVDNEEDRGLVPVRPS
jgi:hypothetical protein